jgi:hypothetical protein
MRIRLFLVSLWSFIRPVSSPHPVTRTLNVNDFQVNDFSPRRLTPSRPPNIPQMPRFQHQPNHFPNPFHAPEMPTIVYLFTSSKKEFQPYITDSPMGVPRPQERRSTNWCYTCRAGWYTSTVFLRIALTSFLGRSSMWIIFNLTWRISFEVDVFVFTRLITYEIAASHRLPTF